jgi:predicted DNA-binding protein (MmcQ/YjbR family)/CheY-like chemotaxis protein
MKATLAAIAERLRQRALSYPGAYEESPWGERVVKIKGKIFYFVGGDDATMRCTVKLPSSGRSALSLPFAEPTHYGLGKAGWVTCTFTRAGDVPIEQLEAWLDESFRAVAPKRVIKELDGADGAGGAASAAPPRKVQKTGRGRKVFIVGGDPLRIERAAQALRDRGYKTDSGDPTPDTLLRLLRAKAALAVVDVGRDRAEGTELVRCLVGEPAPPPLAVAGLRNAADERRMRDIAPQAVLLSRQAPGDDEFLEQLDARLA